MRGVPPLLVLHTTTSFLSIPSRQGLTARLPSTACARAGNPLAIYDEATKTLYLPVSLDHKNPNAKLMGFIEKKVKVSGTVMEKAGLKGIAIEKVEAFQ